MTVATKITATLKDVQKLEDQVGAAIIIFIKFLFLIKPYITLFTDLSCIGADSQLWNEC